MSEKHISQRRIVIVGAGLSGALMACYMGRAGHRVDVYERRPDPRIKGFIGGRSINLAISTRGITALEKIGLADCVLQGVIPMKGRVMHDPQGQLTTQPYSKDPNESIKSISRGGMNLTLLQEADKYDNVTLHFDRPCVDVDLEQGVLIVEANGKQERIDSDLIIGADGAFSAVREAMRKLDEFEFRQDELEHGYKELTIPPNAKGEFAMEPNALHIWPRPHPLNQGFMMIALPNRDKTFTCTCFWPFTGPTGFEAIKTEADVKPFFEKHFPDAVPLMPTLVDDFLRNPTSSLATVRCGPWNYGGHLVLIGDAAHAIVPFYGQGINAGFEDVRILDECLREYEDDWAKALDVYYRRRKKNTDAIADLALDNFIEMRDKVSSGAFLFKKKMEKTIHKIAPGWFTPLYNLISFSNVPYAEARAQYRAKWGIIVTTAIAIALLLVSFVTISLWQTLSTDTTPDYNDIEDVPTPEFIEREPPDSDTNN